MPSSHSKAGFSLVEILVALAVAALALAGLREFILRTSRFETVLQARTQADEASAGVFRSVGLLVEGVSEEFGESPPSAVVGDRSTLKILSRGPRILGLKQQSAYELSYEARTDGSGTIVLTWFDPDANAVRREDVAQGIADFALSYASRVHPLDWQPTWSRPVGELALIRIDLVSARTHQRSTKLFPITPLFPQACVVSLSAKGCPKWPR